LEWTALNPAGTGVQQRRAAPKGEAEATTSANWPEAFAAALALEAPLLKGELHLAIPADGLVLRVLDLPSSDPAEIAGMVELQIDQYSPFPVDLLYLSWEILVAGENRSRVLVAGARRSLIDRLGAAAAAHKLRLQRIDADVLAWLTLLRRAGKLPAEGRHLLVLEDRFATYLLVLDGGHPILIRALPLPAPDSADFAPALSEEVSLALTEVEADWGAAPLAGLLVAHVGPNPHSESALGRDLQLPVRRQALSELDPITDGVALRAQAHLDLSPQAWKDAAKAQAHRSRTLKLALAVAGVWLLGWAVFLGLLAHRQSTVEALRAEVESLNKPAEEVRAIERELAFLTAFTNRSETALDCLRELVVSLPSAGVQLSEFTYKKAVGVSVRGQGSSGPALNFTRALGESPVFKLDGLQVESGKFSFNARLASVPTVDRKGGIGEP
jgi:hypothetical protein